MRYLLLAVFLAACGDVNEVFQPTDMSNVNPDYKPNDNSYGGGGMGGSNDPCQYAQCNDRVKYWEHYTDPAIK
jgi:hypothetical protein